MQLVEHSTLGPYRLERPDPTGSTFRSWRARKIATGEAMRVTFPSPSSRAEQVSPAEADAIEQSLRHVAQAAIPGVPAAQAHQIDGMFFVASPVPAGRCLTEMIERGWPQRLEERLGICAILANLVASAHESGVAHGQLCPEMIYVHPEGRVTVLECGIHPMLAGDQERAVRADVAALGRILYRYFASDWPEEGSGAAQKRNLERLPAALPRSMARKIIAAAAGSADVPSARNLAIHLALDKAWVRAMSESTPPTVEEMQEDAKTRVRVTIAESPDHDEIAPLADRRFSTPEVGSSPPAGTERRYRHIAALSPSSEAGSDPARQIVRKLAVVAAASAVLVGVASTLVLRPRAATGPKAPPPKFAIPYKPQTAAPPQVTYSVRIGPYHEPREVLAAHIRLQRIGFEPILIYSKDGVYLRALMTPVEPKAVRTARGLEQEGFSAMVTETGSDAGMLKAVDAAEPRYQIDGVLFDFEGGQSKGWEIGGTATSMRNSSLFSFSGEHSLEVALQQTTSDSPGLLRMKVENIVLPQDRFLAHVLQPTAASGRLGARFYFIDARGTKFANQLMNLEPEKWSELQLVVSQHPALPIQEIGIELGTPLAPWTGAVYVDRVEQQRPR